MFGHAKQYIRQFAAESLSFLYRKIEMEKLPETVKTILESTKEHPSEDYCNGMALLFFNSVKVCFSI
jgi:U3 small nucleolar RNA-associated protein 20